jgi:uncharacterized repeat protein (TIGR02543 family)
MPKIQFLSRALSTLFASALAIGAAVPVALFSSDSVQAAEITNLSVTSTGPLTAGQANSAPIVVTFTAPTAITADVNNSAYVSLVGASAVTAPSGSSCTGTVTVQNDQGITTTCSLFVSPNVGTQGMGDFGSPVNWPAGTTWTFTYEANTVTLPYAATISVSASTFLASSPPTTFDSARLAVNLVGYVAPTKTVTFNVNGGEGAMANQTASAATALTANSFTRSGYTFTGWNTLADGTGTALADAASFAFTADQTLFAQWAPVPVAQPATVDSTLATTGTGIESADTWSNSALMIVVGFALILIVELRARSQSYLYRINQLPNGVWRNYLGSSRRHN